MSEVKMEEVHKELDLLQGCINRMAQNSFLIKGWLVALFAVVLALLPERVNGLLLGAVMSAVTGILWYLDAIFLTLEKDYRHIYDWVLAVRPLGNRELLYQLDIKAFQKRKKIPDSEPVKSAMWSRTLRWFYGVPMLVSAGYFLIQLVRQCPAA